MKIKVIPNPKFDFFTGLIENIVIPTKQDRFKPLKGRFLTDGELGKGLKFVDHELYVIDEKQTESQKKFTKTLQELITHSLKEKEHPYVNIPIEVVIGISMSLKRLNQVDVDNLAKFILDCLKGLIFVDDNQVVSLVVTKKTVDLPQKNGIMIGIRKLTDKRESILGDMSFYDFEEVKE